MNTKPQTVDEYIASFPPEIKEKLTTLRAIILKNAPDVIESISYGMAGYKTNNKPFVYFGGFKNHIGFYATPNGHEKFKSELSIYKQGKGSVQFPINQPLPIDLIIEIIKFRISENNKNEN